MRLLASILRQLADTALSQGALRASATEVAGASSKVAGGSSEVAGGSSEVAAVGPKVRLRSADSA